MNLLFLFFLFPCFLCHVNITIDTPSSTTAPPRNNNPYVKAGTGSVYDNLPATLPINVVSLGFEANSLTQFGNYVQLQINGTLICPISISTVFSSQIAHSSFPSYPSNGYQWNITIFIYSVNNTNMTYPKISTLVYNQTATFTFPWRPEHNASCPANEYLAIDGLCHTGVAVRIIWNLTDETLILNQTNYVFSVVYNTDHHGFNPVGEAGPYDSLNLGLITTYPTRGYNVINGTEFLNSTDPRTYNDNGEGGLGIMRIDYGWQPYTLPLEVIASYTCAYPTTWTTGTTGTIGVRSIGTTGTTGTTMPPLETTTIVASLSSVYGIFSLITFMMIVYIVHTPPGRILR